MTILDIDLMENQYGKEGAKGMLALLLKSLREELNNLDIAYQKQVWPAILVSTHRVNGSASYCGAEQLMEACSALEIAIKTKSTAKFENLYQKVLEEISLLEKTIKT